MNLHLHDRVALASVALDLRGRCDRMTEVELGAAMDRGRELRERIAETERSDAPPADVAALRPLALSATEAEVVWLLVTIAIDPAARHMSEAIGRTVDPTLDTIGVVVYGAAPTLQGFRELGPQGVLRRLGIIERSDGGGAEVHEARQTWAIARRILALLHGEAACDPALAGIVRIASEYPTVDELAVSEQASFGAREAIKIPRVVAIAAGAPGLGRRTLLGAVAAEAGLRCLEIDANQLAKAPAALATQLRLIARECKLLGCAPLVRNIDALIDDKDTSRTELVAGELAAEVDGPVLVTCGPHRPTLRWARPVLVIELGAPSSAQRARLWRTALGEATPDDADFLATHYPLAPALIHHAGQAARIRARGRTLGADDIYAGIRGVLDDRLGGFARRIAITQTWNDLVLPAEQQRQVDALIARIRQRRTVYEQWGFAAKVGKGLGISALFSGPPGTGKTMVAALIARELGLDLYQVDLAKVVSKWVGETEKNLGALFDAVEAGHAIVLFDEADSLFGKRTEVKSSNDRNANLETNYLLQRLESFTGICLLTSNHASHIDPAFERRLSVHIRLDVPAVDERIRLWQAVLPAAAPIAPDLDLAALARRFAMSGGYIRNAALCAAFLAADDGCSITADHLERAAQLEYEAMGKIAVSGA